MDSDTHPGQALGNSRETFAVNKYPWRIPWKTHGYFAPENSPDILRWTVLVKNDVTYDVTSCLQLKLTLPSTHIISPTFQLNITPHVDVKDYASKHINLSKNQGIRAW